MNTINKTCEKCGVELKPSQYLHRVEDGEPIPRPEDHLVCRNFPACLVAEKEIDKKEYE